jgi:hypothetical protein
VEGFALPGAATARHGQAVALLAWLAAHRAARPARIPAASAGCAVPPETAISPSFGSPVSRLVRRQAQALPDLLLDDLRRGPRVHGVDVLLTPEDLQDGAGLVVIVPQPGRERLLGVIFAGDQLPAARIAPAGDLRAVGDQVAAMRRVFQRPPASIATSTPTAPARMATSAKLNVAG